MKLFEIKSRSTQLTKQCDYDSTNLITTVFNQYYLHLEFKFKSLFSIFREKSYLNQQLFKILAENWEIIKTTGLCYTATPDDEVTEVMIGIAIYLSEQHDYSDKHPLELLMPDVNFESIHDDFQTLNSDDFRTAEKISNIMQSHILADNGLYLIPIFLLTTLDISPVPAKMINPYYNFMQHKEDCGFIKAKELTRLFEHSRITKTIEEKKVAYESLANQENHLLGRLRKLCQSLKLSSRYEDGSEMEAGLTAYQGMVEFADFYNHLFGKSIYMRNKFPLDLSEFNNNYLFIKKSNLYLIQDNQAQLIPLSNKSQFKNKLRQIRNQQSNESHSMQLSVLELYQLIEENSDHQTIDTRISSGLKREIIQLLKFTTNPIANLEATQETSNCVVTLRESLMIQLQGQEDVLSQFKLDSDMEVNLEPTIQEFQQSMQRLKVRVLSKTYDIGFDGLESYAELFDPLDINFEIHTIHELDFIESMGFETIQGIFKNQALRQQAISQFTSINDLVSYLIDQPLQTVECFIACVKNELCSYLIENIEHLNELVRVMDAEYCAVIVKEIGPIRIQSIEDFITLQHNMDIQPFQMACHQLKSLLEGFLDVRKFIGADLDFQNPEKSLFWKTQFLSHAINQIKTYDDWILLKSYMTIEQSDNIFQEEIEQWVEQIDNFADIERLNEQLNDVQQTILITLIRPKSAELISTSRQLSIFLNMLPDAAKKHFLQEHTDLIKHHTENNDQLSEICESLSAELKPFLIDLMRSHIFSVVLQTLDNNSWIEPCDEIAFYLSLKPVYHTLEQLCGITRAFSFIETLIYKDENAIRHHFNQLFAEQSSHRFFMHRSQTASILHELVKLPDSLKRELYSSLNIECIHQSEQKQLNMLKRSCEEICQHQPKSKKHKAHSPV
jgi:hypothetical protein